MTGKISREPVARLSKNLPPFIKTAEKYEHLIEIVYICQRFF